MDDILDLGQGGLLIPGLDIVDLSNLETLLTELEASDVEEIELDTSKGF